MFVAKVHRKLTSTKAEDKDEKAINFLKYYFKFFKVKGFEKSNGMEYC